MDFNKLFARMAGATAHATGTPIAFLLCVTIVAVWGLTGPLFHFSDTWQLVINTGTTIVTFLMVFLIQNTQNRDGAAIQIKLDELILTSQAENDFIGIERLTDVELEALHRRCLSAAEKTRRMADQAEAVLHARRSHHKKVVAEVESTDEPKPKAPARRKPAPKKG
ncbi:MAG TPA: low affinity iron permease family protein [Caulobacteraceae bacterium]|jgi:low affinity Fe/Cu permease|nr:low affinity iron permease family protein [Caulobacteraceae bacterium]